MVAVPFGLLLFSSCARVVRCSFVPPPASAIATTRISIRSRGFSFVSLNVHSLNSGFEWLCEERYDSVGYHHISWIDPAAPIDFNIEETRDEITEIMPLYPLGAVYLPTGVGVNHTLNNVEPRNIQMAQDLLNTVADEKEPRFCAVLRASDTGRIANVGTVLRIVDAKEQWVEGVLTRIRLTCQAESLVELCGIVNPDAFSRENRLRRSPEYLQAKVRRYPISSAVLSDQPNDASTESMAVDLIQNFNMIKNIYQLEIGKDGFPRSALFHLGTSMPPWDTDRQLEDDADFWEAAQGWQSVCATIQQGKQSVLSMDRNERLVEAASAMGGPLKLPIHVEEMPPPVRREIQSMEVSAQQDYLALKMDPCLDFQALISIPNAIERVHCLSTMVARERRRLEMVATETSARSRR